MILGRIAAFLALLLAMLIFRDTIGFEFAVLFGLAHAGGELYLLTTRANGKGES